MPLKIIPADTGPQASTLVALMEQVYGANRVAMGSVDQIVQALKCGARPLLVVVQERMLTTAHQQLVDHWVTSPEFPFNVVVFANEVECEARSDRSNGVAQ